MSKNTVLQKSAVKEMRSQINSILKLDEGELSSAIASMNTQTSTARTNFLEHCAKSSVSSGYEECVDRLFSLFQTVLGIVEYHNNNR